MSLGTAQQHHRSSSTFVEEYAGVVGFYSHLAQSWKYKPPFLHRNLSYKRAAYEEDRRRLNGHRGGDGAANGAAKDQPSDRRGRGSQAGDGEDGPAGHSHRSSSSRTSVIYRLRYNDGQQECVQKKSDFQCAWCEMSCGNVDGLMCHLPACHDRFAYTLVTSTPPEIYVSVRQNSTERVHIQENLSYVSKRRNADSEMDDAAASSEDGAEEEEEEGDYDAGDDDAEAEEAGAIRKRGRPPEPQPKMQKEKKRLGPRGGRGQLPSKGFEEREYFRSQTCLKIEADDMDYDSDDDVDDEWQLKRAEELMDEFVDVTNKEKLFMKLWNRFVHKHAILADFHVPEACRVFATHHLDELRIKGLRDELLFHMFALWDFNLMKKEQIMEVIAIVDRADGDKGNKGGETAPPSSSTGKHAAKGGGAGRHGGRSGGGSSSSSKGAESGGGGASSSSATARRSHESGAVKRARGSDADGA